MTPTEALKELDLSIKVKFVPFSLSRNASEKNPSLNWKVYIHKDNHEFMVIDYMAGCAHCPSYKQIGCSVESADLIKFECEIGYPAHSVGGYPRRKAGAKLIEPKIEDVFYSLTMDADVLEHKDFEEWARSYGYDTDSRTAEKTYRCCLEQSLKLRLMVGDQGLQILREAFQDY